MNAGRTAIWRGEEGLSGEGDGSSRKNRRSLSGKKNRSLHVDNVPKL